MGKAGDHLQNESEKMLQGILGTIQATEQTGNEILLELQSQSEQLDRINEKVVETQDVLERTNKLVGYFEKQVKGDKCCKIIIGLMVLATIVIFILTTFGGGLDFSDNKKADAISGQSNTPHVPQYPDPTPSPNPAPSSA